MPNKVAINKELEDLIKARGMADSFRQSIRNSVYGLWTGAFDTIGFLDNMTRAIRRYYTFAWQEGARDCGILPSDLTPDELMALEREISSQYQYLIGFANAIESNSKRRKGKLGPLHKRGEMWISRYSAVRDLAKSYACRDAKLKWVWNPNKEHCSSCQRLNSRVYRASIWRKYDIYPRMHRLACKGYRCGCVFEKTLDAVTPGRPPTI